MRNSAKIMEMLIEKMSMQNEKKYIAKLFLRKKGCLRVETFLKLTKQWPDCVSVACNRCFYSRSVTDFKCDKCNHDLTNITHPVALNSTDYICKTCHNNRKKSCAPVQTVFNKLLVFLPPDELKNLNILERVLISQRILFKKVVIMPKGQFPKFKGAIYNIPIETMGIINTLSQGADSTALLMVKFKKKKKISRPYIFSSSFFLKNLFMLLFHV